MAQDASAEPVEVRALREAVQHAVLEAAGFAHAAPTEPAQFLALITTAEQAAGACTATQRSAVAQARRLGLSWAAIGAVLGISRQAAQQRFAPEPAMPDAESRRITVDGAHAFNEMQLLAEHGRHGRHLVGFGPLVLYLQPSSRQWRHRRELAWHVARTRRRLEADGWVYVGTWFPFHYFKRAGTEPALPDPPHVEHPT